MQQLRTLALINLILLPLFLVAIVTLSEPVGCAIASHYGKTLRGCTH